MVEKNPAVLARLKAPAICLIVMSGIGLVFWVISLFTGGASEEQLQQLRDSNMPEWFVSGAASGSLVMSLLTIAITVVVLVGSLKMMKAESWGLAVTASILAMIPCFGPCCGLTLPFGIWALVVLMNDEVKRTFQA